MKLSVIIPVHNGEKHLERCLKSIVNQTFADMEIIIVNDGSTDDSRQICENFVEFDKRIVLINQANKGLSGARNAGITIAKGDYVGFVDGDDWVDLNFFEKLYDTAINHTADIAVADFIREYPHSQKHRLKLKEEKVYFNTPEKYAVCRMHKEGCVWNKIYKRNLIEENGLRFEEGVFYEDREFTAKILHYSNKLVTAENTYYHYFVNNNSITRNRKTKKQKQDYIRAKQKVLEFIKEKNIAVPDWVYFAEKSRVELFGIPFFIVKQSTKTERFCLFGIFPIFARKN
ncbi:MAG: glycosyltransferase [Candidatus Gastranaerophilaceae bacterium]